MLRKQPPQEEKETVIKLLSPLFNSIEAQGGLYSCLKWVKKGEHRQKAIEKLEQQVINICEKENYHCKVTDAHYYQRRINLHFEIRRKDASTPKHL